MGRCVGTREVWQQVSGNKRGSLETLRLTAGPQDYYYISPGPNIPIVFHYPTVSNDFNMCVLTPETTWDFPIVSQS